MVDDGTWRDTSGPIQASPPAGVPEPSHSPASLPVRVGKVAFWAGLAIVSFVAGMGLGTAMLAAMGYNFALC